MSTFLLIGDHNCSKQRLKKYENKTSPKNTKYKYIYFTRVLLIFKKNHPLWNLFPYPNNMPIFKIKMDMTYHLDIYTKVFPNSNDRERLYSVYLGGLSEGGLTFFLMWREVKTSIGEERDMFQRNLHSLKS